MKEKTFGPSRTWIKLYTTECLRGSIRDELTVEERSVWFDLLLMAGDSRVDGIICATARKPYTHRRISQMLDIPLALLTRSLAKFTEQGKITEDAAGIHITKWHIYQADYRSRKKAPEEGTEPEPSKELSPKSLEKQAARDAKDLHSIRDQLSPERVAAAEDYIKRRYQLK